MPRQPLGSNKCGLSSLKYAELILTSPEVFTRKLLNENLHDWFPIETIENMRSDLAERIQFLAVEQRKDGGPMVGQHLDLPLPSPSIVFAQVMNHINPFYHSVREFYFINGTYHRHYKGDFIWGS